MGLLTVEKSIPWLASLVGSYAGWYLGALVSTFAAFIVMIIGAGVGLYFGKRWVRQNL